jgi:hypothetical protein
VYLGREPAQAAWLEFVHPRWDDAQGYAAYILNAGARLRVGQATALIVEVPMATSSDESGFGDDGFLLGNPYVGVRQRLTGVTAELGLRPPVVGADAPGSTQLGTFLGDFDRLEAFGAEAWTFRGDVMYEATSSGGFRTTLGAGPTVLLPKDDDAELLLDYRLGVGYALAPVVLSAWFTGRWITTADGATFNESSVHHLAFSAAGNRGRLRPAGYLRLPLDEDLDPLKMVFGLGLTYGF